MKGIVNEFKDFAIKGNVVDMAIGIIIGTAFGNIVKSFVNDIIMPPFGLLLGGIDFSEFMIVLKQGTEDVPAITISYGVFINTIINFLIVAGAIFLVVRQLQKLKKKKDDEEAKKPNEELEVLKEIRDHLKN